VIDVKDCFSFVEVKSRLRDGNVAEIVRETVLEFVRCGSSFQFLPAHQSAARSGRQLQGYPKAARYGVAKRKTAPRHH
jgi:hypothetical protein